MKEIQEYEKDLASIRSMMERSGKFISLSGMSGILAGVYALAGAGTGWWILQNSLFSNAPFGMAEVRRLEFQLLAIAVIVLVASIGTGLWLSGSKAKKSGVSLWNASSRQMMMNLAIPLITGGIFILIMLYNGLFVILAPATLIFYGLALIHASANTYDEIRYLGFSEIALGLVCALFSPLNGLIFWALGFGVLHILYGAILYNKYDR
ncbi:MAG: hypothetical protein WDN75_13770 [Bacteroidota bacterium]